MQSNSDFKLNENFALLLIGPPLTGKTNLAFNFPDPYFFDADDKLANAVARHRGKKFFYDNGLRDNKGVAIAPEKRWTHVVSCLKAACIAPEVGAIVLDSATTLSAFLTEHIVQYPSTAKIPLMVGGIKVMDQSMWGPFRDLWTRTIMMCRGSGKPVILICHEEFEKDEQSGTMIHRPLIPGALKSSLGGLFTDVWRTETRQTMKGGKTVTEYIVRTQPTPRMALGNSLGLPAEFEFNYETFKSLLDASRGKEAAL